MTTEELEVFLKDTLDLTEVHVKSDGSHFNIIAVSNQFDEMSRVKRQQFVYGPLTDKIADGSMHAVSIKTFNEEQWRKEKLFNMPM
ncbi:MAG: BolA family protein [Glaciecola sp.]|jgi:acid stress-induced BolA-like protein IbaG/YrbA